MFDLGDTRMFEAAVLPAVVIATQRPSHGRTRFVSVYRADEPIHDEVPNFPSVPALLASGQVGNAVVDGTVLRVRRGTLSSDGPSDQPWTLEDEGTKELLGRIASATNLTIGSIAKIRVGIKTTADSVFIRDDWDALPPELRPESELIHPILTHHVAGRWRARTPLKAILYPHRDVGGRTVSVDLGRYPRAAAYLRSQFDRLSSRDYVTSSGRQWFEIWVPQKAHLWSMPKVVFPDIADSPKFFVDTEGNLVNGDCYWASTASVDEALLIAAVGNSAVARAFYDAQCGNQLYAGRRRFMTQYVERFPVPDPSSPAGRGIVALARELHDGVRDMSGAEAELEALIRGSLGFEEAPRKLDLQLLVDL